MTRPVRSAGRLPATLALLATLAVTGWLGVAGVAGPLPAPGAAAAEQCVGVVVDARLLGGGVRTGCAKGDPSSGLKALTAAGFSYAFLPRQPGLVCQIDGVPACEDTSTTTYWSYWHRAKGSSTWVYSTSGAGSHDPKPGSTEAWVWQDGGRREPPDISQRTICPPAARSSAPSSPKATSTRSATQRASSRPSSEPSPAATEERRAGGGKTGAAGRTSEESASSAAPSPTEAAPTTTGTPDAGAVTSSPRTTSAASESSAGGTPWTGVAVGGALIVALGAAAVARSRRGGP